MGEKETEVGEVSVEIRYAPLFRPPQSPCTGS